MSFEAMTSIIEAEKAADAAVSDAQVAARQIVSDAENAGREAVEAAKRRAEKEKSELAAQTEEIIAKAEEESRKETSNSLEALGSIASGKIDLAAKIVAERIAKG